MANNKLNASCGCHKLRKGLIALAMLLSTALPIRAQQQDPDPVLLDKAIEYFTSAKYHEALLIFQRLDKRYKLNERFRAYIGLCYYHEWEYKKAAQYLDEALPALAVLAPHERSVYHFAAAESHFLMQQYKEATPHYEFALALCYDREKAEINYRLGLCYMFAEKWKMARNYFAAAQLFYQKYRNVDNVEARWAQATKMRAGCQAKIDEKLRADSIALAKAREDSIRQHTIEIPLGSIILEQFPPIETQQPQKENNQQTLSNTAHNKNIRWEEQSFRTKK